MNKIILVSVDFDYFVREKEEWDWGHYEDYEGDSKKTWLFLRNVWIARYITGDVDVWSETDPDRYADFRPELLPMFLGRKGLFGTGWTGLWIGDSHRHAYEQFSAVAKRKEGRIIVVHFDAHTDMREITGKVDTGNWLAEFIHRHRDRIEKVYHVLPKWFLEEGSKDEVIREMRESLPEELKDEGRIEFTFYEDLPDFGKERINAIYLARSGAWTPPHLDGRFFKMAGAVIEAYRIPERKIKVMNDLYDRSINMRDLEKLRDEFRKMKRELLKKARDREMEIGF